MARTSKPLPTNDHAARFCHPAALNNDGAITAAAFVPRPRDEKRLSAVWVECTDDRGGAQQERATGRICRDHIDEFHEDGKIAAMEVRSICSIAHGGALLTVFHRKPSKKSRGMPCHARIGMFTQDEEVLETAKALADLANEGWIFQASG